MKNLILLRGLPGAGKSTLAKVLSNSHTSHFEADMYFIDEHGNYNFDSSKLRDAHEWCKRQVESAMGPHGFDRIFVANTFTQEWEFKEYYELAAKYGYRVHSLIIENRHGNKSVHNVPDASMGNMLNRFNVKL
jgi:predicted kinase